MKNNIEKIELESKQYKKTNGQKIIFKVKKIFISENMNKMDITIVVLIKKEQEDTNLTIRD